MFSVKTAVTTLGLGLYLFSTTSLRAEAAPEYRSIWVNGWSSDYNTPAKCSTVISNARAGNFNTVVMQARRRGDSFYNSNFEPKNSGVPSNFDPLADLIAKGNDTSGGQQRIAIHAWLVTYHIWGSSTPPRNPDHPFNRHRDWLLQDTEGKTFIGGQYTFDPGHPEVQRHTFNVFTDLMTNYNVDGFNFDYVRYSGPTEGYNPVSVARFNSRYGRTGQPAPQDPLWKQWRRDQITALVRKIYLTTMAVKPQMKVIGDLITWAPGVTNAASWTNKARAYNDVLQDWRAWMEEGILDISRPMNYFRETNSTYANDYREWCHFAADHKYNRHTVIGPGLYLNTLSNCIAQMRFTRQASVLGNKPDGVCGYDYRTSNNEGLPLATFLNALVAPGKYDAITPPIFAERAELPVMPWKASPTKGHLKGFIVGGSHTNYLDGASISIAGPMNRTFISDATGFFGSVDLPPGDYTLNASFKAFSKVTTNFSIKAGIVTTADLTLPKPAGVPASIVGEVSSSEIVVDNKDAIFSAGWTTEVKSAKKYADDFCSITGSPKGSGATGTFRPNIPVAGKYDVYIWYPHGSNHSTNAPWHLAYHGGTQTTHVNQQINGGKWFQIGSAKNFAAGTNGFVQVSNNVEGKGLVIADAVRFVHVQEPGITAQPNDLVVNVGQAAKFVVAATGTTPLKYQWRFNGADISNATNSSLHVANAQLDHAGFYSVVIVNSIGAATSAPAELSVQRAKLKASGVGSQ